MLNLNEVKSILERLVKWDEFLDSDSESMEPDDVLTDIALDARAVLRNITNLKGNQRHWLVSWEYASGIDENLNIQWKPMWERFYDSDLGCLSVSQANTKVSALKNKKNIRNISLKLCADVSIILDEVEVS